MSPYRIYKTLVLHGPCTAREVAAAWAVVPVEDVRDTSAERILSALEVMQRHDMVTQDIETAVWMTLPLPEDGNDRRNLLRRVDREWKKVRRGPA